MGGGGPPSDSRSLGLDLPGRPRGAGRPDTSPSPAGVKSSHREAGGERPPAPRPAARRPGARSSLGSEEPRGPWKANKRPGRAGSAPRPRDWCPRPGLLGRTAALLPGTAAFTAPAPPACGERRPRSCCGQSAATRGPQLRPSAGALAPPIVKGPAGGSAYKASAGHMQPCTANLVSRYSGVAPSRPIGGQAGPRCSARRRLRCSAAPARVPAADPAARSSAPWYSGD